MKLKIIWILSVLVLVVSLIASLLANSSTFEDNFCKDITELNLGCSDIYFIDHENHLVFFSDGEKLMYAKIDEKWRMKDVGLGAIELNSIPGPQNDPLFWQGGQSIIFGLATNDVQTINIISETNRQPNKFKVNDRWVWYLVLDNEKVNLPVIIEAFDQDGNLIYEKD